VGLGLIFVPLTNASMAELDVRQLHQGTGLYNLTRQLGGSLGIAILATQLATLIKGQKAILTEHVVSTDPSVLARVDGITRAMVARGADLTSAKQMALQVLDRQVAGQASVLAFSKIYLISGIALLCALPLLLVFKSGRARGATGPMH
jgi:DHA2 family multidrug resistance protein